MYADLTRTHPYGAAESSRLRAEDAAAAEAYVAAVAGKATRRKLMTHRQPATAEAIRDLCAVHLASVDELLETAHLSRTPRCLWEAEVTPRGAPLRHGAGGTTRPVPATPRECLTHDHRCRSATALYELATSCHRMAGELATLHRREVAEARREVAAIRRCVVEWEAAFGRDLTVTPATVGAELRSLRLQVADLRRENAALRAQQQAFFVQHDSLARYHDPMGGASVAIGGGVAAASQRGVAASSEASNVFSRLAASSTRGRASSLQARQTPQ